MAILELADVSIAYGQRDAVKGISMQVSQGGITTLLGGNGAGKTTTLRAVSGLRPARAGTVTFDGRNITRVAAHRIVELGIAHCPEGRRVFPTLTVEENLTLGGFVHRSRPKEVKRTRDEAFELFPRLLERRSQLAGTLSGGEQQMLAIGRALMASPKLLLLDEPSLGLAPMLVQEIFRTIQEVNNRGVSVLLVEQNARQALRIADNAYVIETGRIRISGTAAELQGNEEVRAAYLGQAKQAAAAS